jgi:acyl-coenzyme A synthetase/AMP-(fatty) acid ligase
VTEPGASATADELTDHVASLLTKHKRPREVHFLDELPRNAMGKVMKRELGT